MRLRVACLVGLLASLPAVASADTAPDPSASPACATPGSLECPTYQRFTNHKYGFSLDVPTLFVKKTGDADGRGQPFEHVSNARTRPRARFHHPPLTPPPPHPPS